MRIEFINGHKLHIWEEDDLIELETDFLKERGYYFNVLRDDYISYYNSRLGKEVCLFGLDDYDSDDKRLNKRIEKMLAKFKKNFEEEYIRSMNLDDVHSGMLLALDNLHQSGAISKDEVKAEIDRMGLSEDELKFVHHRVSTYYERPILDEIIKDI